MSAAKSICGSPLSLADNTGYTRRMAFVLNHLSDLRTADFDEIIDVRSPSEFREDHIPGAVNLPALSDEERAEVGTIYVQDSRFRARKVGAAMVARNVAGHLERHLSDKPGSYRPLLYCWRGGQRSGSFASILNQIGWRCDVLQGGYKSYRSKIVKMLYEEPVFPNLVLLDGNTGTAKTEILHLLQANGVQTIDLEGLANHRGSLLGARAAGQPSQKAFESAVAQALEALKPDDPVVLEAESSKVGNLIVPPSLWQAMQHATRISVAAPVDARARYLVGTYADLIERPDELAARLESLSSLHGHTRVSEWQEMVTTGAFSELARALIEVHYDPRYKKRTGQTVGTVISLDDLSSADLEAAAHQVVEAVRQI